jgi:hypothetical protein
MDLRKEGHYEKVQKRCMEVLQQNYDPSKKTNTDMATIQNQSKNIKGRNYNGKHQTKRLEV